MTEVVLGLGSNKSYGEKKPLELLAHACAALRKILHDCAYSSVYKTGALYVTEQQDFLNMVVAGTFDGTPQQLLQKIHFIEGNLGRNRAAEVRNGPRPLDIDIELFGNERVNDANLVIPHEKLLERAFVLVPLVEILRNSADGRIRDCVASTCGTRFESALEAVQDQRIEKILDSASFQATADDDFPTRKA